MKQGLRLNSEPPSCARATILRLREQHLRVNGLLPPTLSSKGGEGALPPFHDAGYKQDTPSGVSGRNRASRRFIVTIRDCQLRRHSMAIRDHLEFFRLGFFWDLGFGIWDLLPRLMADRSRRESLHKGGLP